MMYVPAHNHSSGEDDMLTIGGMHAEQLQAISPPATTTKTLVRLERYNTE
jgi:hypothetical protein